MSVLVSISVIHIPNTIYGRSVKASDIYATGNIKSKNITPIRIKIKIEPITALIFAHIIILYLLIYGEQFVAKHTLQMLTV